MTAKYEAFMSPFVAFWTDDVSEAPASEWLSKTDNEIRYSLTSKKIADVYLDDTDTYIPTFTNVDADAWRFIAVKVKGTARLETTGFDTDGTTPITGYIPMYGVSYYPGLYLLSTYNITSFLIRGQADGTSVELFAGIALEDSEVTDVGDAFAFQFTQWQNSGTTAGTIDPSAGSVILASTDITASGPTGGVATFRFNRAGTYSVTVNLSHAENAYYLGNVYFALTLGGTADRYGQIGDSETLGLGVSTTDIQDQNTQTFICVADENETVTVKPQGVNTDTLSAVSIISFNATVMITPI